MIPAVQSVAGGFGSPGNRSGDPIESHDHSEPDAHSESGRPDPRRASADPPVRLQSTDQMIGTLLDVVA